MTAAWVADVARDVVIVSGADSRSFLQSLVSQDLAPIVGGQGARSLLLQPQGKLIAEFVVLCIDDDEWWLVTEGGFGSVLADGLNRFRIRVKVEVRVAAELAVAEVRGTTVPGTPGERYAHCALDGGVRLVRHDWPNAIGTDLIGAPAALGAIVPTLDAVRLDAAAYEQARIAAGVVRLGRDVDASTIAQEAHLETDAVSFTKGCFVGQELVCRIDTRGHVNRYVRRLVFDAPVAEITAGAEVRHDAKVVGTVTSSAAGSPIALATLRREVEPGATVDVGGRTARVAELSPAADPA